MEGLWVELGRFYTWNRGCAQLHHRTCETSFSLICANYQNIHLLSSCSIPNELHLWFDLRQKLDFTLSDGSNLTEAVSKRTLSPEELNKQLEKLLLEDLAGDEQIFDWVEVDLQLALQTHFIEGCETLWMIFSLTHVHLLQANLDESEMSSPPFLRALMTSVCKAAVKSKWLIISCTQ